MGFFNLIGLISLICVPIIIILHMLKKKQKDIKIPSIYLWERAVDSSVQSKPWQKLKKSLPLILQITAALALGLAAGRPYISAFGKAYNYVIVIDSSGSMSAEDMGESRLEYAKKEAVKLIKDASVFSKITVISSGENPTVIYGPDTDKNEAEAAVRSIKQTYGGTEKEMTESLAVSEALKTEGGIYVFTDDKDMFSDTDANVIYAGNSRENCAVTFASASEGSVLVNVKNYGESEQVKTITLFDGNVVVAVADVTLPSGSERSIVFEDIYADSAMLTITLSPEDILTADDTYYLSVNKAQSAKILLVTDGNTFFENALSIVDGTEIYKMSPTSMETALLNGYDLYIFDGCMPDTLPDDGGIIAVNPPVGNTLIEVTGNRELNAYAKGTTKLTAGESLEFIISKAKTVTKPSWAQTECTADGVPLILRGETGGQKICVFTFDIHDSDLPLLKDFPIMIYNLSDWFVPGRSAGYNTDFCEEKLGVSIPASSEKVTVTNPEGNSRIIAPPYPALDYTDTAEAGFYEIRYEMSDGSAEETILSVNAKRDGESDLDTLFGQDKSGSLGTASKGGASLMNILIAVAIIALIAEWWVKYSGIKRR